MLNFINLENYINEVLSNNNSKDTSNLYKKFLNNFFIALLVRPFSYLFSLLATQLLKSKLFYEVITKVCKIFFKERNKSGIIKKKKKI